MYLKEKAALQNSLTFSCFCFSFVSTVLVKYTNFQNHYLKEKGNYKINKKRFKDNNLKLGSWFACSLVAEPLQCTGGTNFSVTK